MGRVDRDPHPDRLEERDHERAVAKVKFNKDTRSHEIDQYSAEPVKLVNVEVFVPKPKP